MTAIPDPVRGIHAANGAVDRPANASEVLKFTAMAALLAISADAAIAHAMLWGNDPYWTYWVTDTLLMATVFGLGTAWFGMGLLRGALITCVHIVLLTTYYWSLSPIGLPAQPEWLDLERTWITGLPVHLAVYYLGYVLALWLWRRAPRRATVVAPGTLAPGPLAALALVTGVAIVVLVGVVQALVTQEFPGLTWFVMRTAVAVPVTFAWWALAGRTVGASIAGGCVLALVLAAYGHFLAPVGLPNPEWRLLAIDPPPAEVHWLSWRLQFLVMLPLGVAAAVGAFVLAGRWRAEPRVPVDVPRRSGVMALAAVLALVALGAWTAPRTGAEANRAIVVAEDGAGSVLRMTVENRNTHRTPLPPHDRVDIEARVRADDGTALVVRAAQPMVAQPLGRFTTWGGVGLDVWHHGRSGIGTSARPAVNSDVAVHAVGTVSAGGRVLATGVPVHVMTDPVRGSLELHVGDGGIPLPGVDSGRLRVVWPEYRGGHDRTPTNARYAWGTGVLLVLLGWAFTSAWRQRRPAGRYTA